MDESHNASYYVKEKSKIKTAKWGIPKFKKIHLFKNTF
jgi:hypothetical protein